MREDLKHTVEKRQQYSKNTYGPSKSYKGRNYKRKTYDNRFSQTTAKLREKEQQPRTQTKELKVMGHTRMLEKPRLVLLLREKTNIIVLATLLTTMKIGEVSP